MGICQGSSSAEVADRADVRSWIRAACRDRAGVDGRPWIGGGSQTYRRRDSRAGGRIVSGKAKMMVNVDHEAQVAFPKLSPSEIETLAGMARLCSFEDGATIFEAGQRGLPLYVVESGGIAIV